MTRYTDAMWNEAFRRLVVQMVIAAGIIAVLAIGWMAAN